MFREVGAQGVEEVAVLGVDGADPVEEVVVLPHLFQPLFGDSAAVRHVPQEGDDVVGSLGAAEGEQQEGVVGGGIAHIGHVSILPPGGPGEESGLRSRRVGP